MQALGACLATASLVSDAILPTLDRGGSGRIEGVFGAAFNVAIDPDLRRDSFPTVIAVVAPAVGAVPNGIVVDAPLDFRSTGLRTGQRVVFVAGRVTVSDAAVEIHTADAASWSPRIERLPGATLRHWPRRSRQVRTTAAEVARDRGIDAAGFAPLLDGAREDGRLHAAAGLARPRLDRLATSLASGDDVALVDAAASLLGLGPGLTPSGDDALVGLAAALAAFDPDRLNAFRQLDALVPSRTTAVAAAYVRHALRGELAERIHRVVSALLVGAAADLRQAIDAALGWGATSGADTLVGLLAALDALAGVDDLPNVHAPAHAHFARRVRPAA